MYDLIVYIRREVITSEVSVSVKTAHSMKKNILPETLESERLYRDY